MAIKMRSEPLAIVTAMMTVLLLDLAPLQAQPRTSCFIFSIAAGPALFPMREWETFAGEIINSRYENQPVSLTGKISAGVHLNERSTLHLDIELLVSKAMLFFYPYVENPSGPDLPVLQVNTTHWTFTGIPVTLSYLHHFRNSSSPWTPYLGLGLSYYYSEVEADYTLLYDPWLIGYPVANETARTDAGYGTVLVAGMNVPMFGRVHLTPQLRYRWADASAFGDPNNPVISFTGYDISLGITWNP